MKVAKSSQVKIRAYAWSSEDDLDLILVTIEREYHNEEFEGGWHDTITFDRVVNEETGAEVFPHDPHFDRELRYRLEEGACAAQDNGVMRHHANACWKKFDNRTIPTKAPALTLELEEA